MPIKSAVQDTVPHVLECEACSRLGAFGVVQRSQEPGVEGCGCKSRGGWGAWSRLEDGMVVSELLNGEESPAEGGGFRCWSGVDLEGDVDAMLRSDERMGSARKPWRIHGYPGVEEMRQRMRTHALEA